jgi:hypothetical protein
LLAVPAATLLRLTGGWRRWDKTGVLPGSERALVGVSCPADEIPDHFWHAAALGGIVSDIKHSISGCRDIHGVLTDGALQVG